MARKDDAGRDVLTHGLKVSEYPLPPPTDEPDGKPRLLVYVEMIDTSGHLAVPGLSRSLVASCLAASQRTAAAASAHMSVHIFARARPQLLFGRSAKAEGKRKLEERALVGWWMRSLVGWWNSAAKEDDAALKATWFVPGESERSMADLLRALPKPNGSNAGAPSVAWAWGLPYPANAVATTAVPRFPDDAKTKGLDLLDARSTVRDLMEVLATTGECGSGRLAGFLSAYVPARGGPVGAEDHAADADNGWYAVSSEAMESVVSALMGEDFSTAELAVESTGRVKALLENLGVQARVEVMPNVASVRVEPPRGETNLGTATPPAVVHNLQGKLKRKADVGAPAPAVLAPAVHNLQGLVKKTKTDGAVGANDIQGHVKRKAG
ncbi:hypothetical protein HK101_003243 [Irineochytrium annulatum]|nr:hypothetical protein HK101_003243 [Irineochytrium annulatum]